jgi:predicted ATP-grasp superfamily ATP-dependent carboligase
VPPATGEHATRLLDAIGWHGVAMVEFKNDERDAVPKLMEINGRLWGSLQLAIDAGVDFPALIARSAIDGTFPPQPAYRVGVRNRWFWGDVDSLLMTLRKNGPAGDRRKSRLSAVGQFLKLWGTNYDNPKPDDVYPWLWETYSRAASIFGRGGIRRSQPALP